MRIMLDTNVIVSLLLFPNRRMNAMMEYILAEHELVLSSFVVDELKDVVRRKFPAREHDVDTFLLKLSYDLVYTPEKIDGSLFDIRDEKDYPVLYTAIIENIDILVTGDGDFADVEIERPEILTPADFMARHLRREPGIPPLERSSENTPF
ncbi:hypothetical protein SDC9_166392 [bioreactor metagenome]|uniref:PIN domain-containing protein n=1 Tax=bioreactor metagenome TaxID=1076179 RepID=A0A645FYN9_9ZZZZ